MATSMKSRLASLRKRRYGGLPGYDENGVKVAMEGTMNDNFWAGFEKRAGAASKAVKAIRDYKPTKAHLKHLGAGAAVASVPAAGVAYVAGKDSGHSDGRRATRRSISHMLGD